MSKPIDSSYKVNATNVKTTAVITDYGDADVENIAFGEYWAGITMNCKCISYTLMSCQQIY